jgi:diacylglycerol kinase family enzyme
MLTIGNGAWYGGGFRGAPDARLDDGVLDCYAFRDVPGVLRRFALMQRIRVGAHPGEPNVTPLRAADLHVEFDRSVAMHVDGEISHAHDVHVALVPGGATILAPTASPIPTSSSWNSSPARA